MTPDADLTRRILRIYDNNNAGYPAVNDAQRAYVVTCVTKFLPSAATDEQIYGALRRARPEILNGTFQSLGKNAPNTRIEYLYVDADNYKKQNQAVINGRLTDEQKAIIMDSLDDGEYFIPSLVGLPEHKFDRYDPQSDHPFFRLNACGFSDTSFFPTVEITPDELTAAFAARKGHWCAIEHARALELLQLIVDDMAHNGTAPAADVAKKLIGLGFNKEELEVLGLTF